MARTFKPLHLESCIATCAVMDEAFPLISYCSNGNESQGDVTSVDHDPISILRSVP